MKKDKLTYEDINQLLYLLTSDEAKLLNLKEYDRYILGKFYTWIREFVKILEEIYKLKQQLKEGKLVDKETEESLQKTEQIMIHNVKFLVDVFLFLSRSSLSINAKAFVEFLKQKFEYEYKGSEVEMPQEKRELKLNIFGR